MVMLLRVRLVASCVAESAVGFGDSTPVQLNSVLPGCYRVGVFDTVDSTASVDEDAVLPTQPILRVDVCGLRFPRPGSSSRDQKCRVAKAAVGFSVEYLLLRPGRKALVTSLLAGPRRNASLPFPVVLLPSTLSIATMTTGIQTGQHRKTPAHHKEPQETTQFVPSAPIRTHQGYL
ncbi:hypothetical protein WN48_09670 [Eufriesea mexicana]|uniref:Secreted protein n=1 Tax=Eufriesea mexicana TaxID=516756 RepID=A0A310SH51_9HYME|nr:hypothetical protein WN48_09670 [Eufriesea mexicana]